MVVGVSGVVVCDGGVVFDGVYMYGCVFKIQYNTIQTRILL